MRHATLTLLACLFAISPAMAQELPSLSGTVRDTSGAAIASASVAATNAESGAVRRSVSDGEGRYTFAALPIGRYELLATKPNFRTESRRGIQLDLGTQAVVDLVLEVGEAREEVTVSGSAPPLNTSTAETEGLVGESEVKDLPLNGRSYDQLLTLNPGIVNYTAQRTGGIGISNSAVGNMFTVSGRRPQEN